MKWIARSVLLLAFIAIASQDITGRKGCDCSVCKGVDNKINPIVGKRNEDDGGGKSSCNICERRKELLRMEREKQRQLSKCPFEILGAPSMKGKTSEEIFDEFRELIVPSQNGFFDMMRGIVKTMHVSSVAELKWAKEKEARELAKKKKEEAEEAKKRKDTKPPKDEMVGLNNPVNPKVTVVLKQTPCGQIIQPSEQVVPGKISLTKRLPKETDSGKIPEEEVLPLQWIDLTDGHYTGGDYGDLNSKGNLLRSDLIDELMGLKTTTVLPPDEEEESMTSTKLEQDLSLVEEQRDSVKSLLDTTDSPFMTLLRNDDMKALPAATTAEPEHESTAGELTDSFESSKESPFVKFLRNDEMKTLYSTTAAEPDPLENFSAAEEETASLESSTESPFVKFLSNEELKALSGGKNSLDDFDAELNMLPTGLGVDEENAHGVDYSVLPIS